MLALTTLSAEHFDAFFRFVAQTWPERTRDPAFLRWRYVHAPDQTVHVAVRDGEVVACLGVRHRTWVVGAGVVPAGETWGWFCRPDLRMSGLGVRLMKKVMHAVTPIVASGGTADTRTLLPRLGWQQIGEVQQAMLPLRGAAVAGPVASRLGVPEAAVRVAFDAVGRHAFGRLPAFRPADVEVSAVAGIGDEVVGLVRPGPLGLAAVPHPAQDRWARGYPGQGAHFALYLRRRGRLVGYSRVRVARGDATIVDAFTTDDALWKLLVRESVDAARGFGPVAVRAQASHPALVAALRANRFLFGRPDPLWLWSGRNGPVPAGVAHVVADLEDHAWIPFPDTSWPG